MRETEIRGQGSGISHVAGAELEKIALSEEWKYQNERVALIPYDRSWEVFPDGILGHLYLRTRQDERLDLVFDTGTRFDEFVSYFAKKTIAMQVYALKEGENLIPAGYCWVDDVVGRDSERRAMFGLCWFKEYRGRPEVAELGWMCLEYWFNELRIDVLFGATMETNTAAKNFARRFGFEDVGTVPKFLYRQGKLTSARVVMLEKSKFEEQVSGLRNQESGEKPERHSIN